jgi:hypothetical protein
MCQEMFFACMKRVILTDHDMMEKHVAKWHENPPEPKVYTRADGTEYEIPPNIPETYSLKDTLSGLTAFVVDVESSFTRCWFHFAGK